MDSISSVENALSFLYQLDLSNGGYCFRGQADSAWELEPTIHRKKYGYKRYQTVIYEGMILNELKGQDLPLVFSEHEIEILMMCQHYGMPTRLLDWSNDLLTALYFACADTENMKKNASLFVCTKLAYPKYQYQKLSDVLEHAFIDTYMVNLRMRAQSGCFMLWGNAPINQDSTESYTLQEYNDKYMEEINSRGIDSPIIELEVSSDKKILILDELKHYYGMSDEIIYLHNQFSLKNEMFYENIRIQCQGLTKYLTE